LERKTDVFTNNESTLDRDVRLALGLMLFLVATFALGGVVQIVLYVLAGILLLTGVVGFCPLYAVLHINTCAVRSNKKH
jgi:hypothetical protein